MPQKPDVFNVVLNFHQHDQDSARILMELLMAVEEGMNCKYHLQYGNAVNSLRIHETILHFIDSKDASFSTQFPDIEIPVDMVENDPNLLRYDGNHTLRTRAEKRRIFMWNLCVYKYIRLIDSFLVIEPDCIVLKHEWLREIYSEWKKCEVPVFGHLKKGKINHKYVPTHWAGCSVYDSRKLRELPLEYYFYHRYENPWWKYRNEEGTVTEGNCFWGPVFSGYDISYDYFLFALYWREKTGVNDPFQWPLESLDDKRDLIFCDFHSKMKSDEVFERFVEKLPLIHGIKDDEIRERVLKHFGSTTNNPIPKTGYSPPKHLHPSSGGSQEKHDRLSGPSDGPLRNNEKHLTIGDLRDMFAGKRCFIIGNGPSLQKTPMKRLTDEYTIGSNRIYLNYDSMGFEPTFYCAVNRYVIEQFYRGIDRLNSIKFLRKEAESLIRNRRNTFFMESYGVHHFNPDLETLKWCEGWTVTFCAMQVAFYLGFETVILVGVDHRFEGVGEPNKLVIATGADENHFHPEYFGKNVKWQYPDLKRSEISYAVAKEVYEKKGRLILDATIGGNLKIFPRVDFHEVLRAGSVPRSAASFNRQGEALFSQGDVPGSVVAFEKAIEMNPNFSTPYNNLGVLSWQMGRARQAEEYFLRALKIEPDDRDTIVNYGEVLNSLDRFKEARRLYSSFLRKNTNDLEIRDLLRRVSKGEELR